jgi:hypothetical protein
VRVVCISEYPSEEQIKRLGKNFHRKQTFGLVVGQEYLVLGLRFEEDSPLYGTGMVVEYFNGDHLVGAPLCLFEIKNPSASRFWEARKWEDDSLTLWPSLFYEEYFHDRLSDYEPEPRAKFKEIYDLMESEDHGLLDLLEQSGDKEA